jgi:hypothetical protein
VLSDSSSSDSDEDDEVSVCFQDIFIIVLYFHLPKSHFLFKAWSLFLFLVPLYVEFKLTLLACCIRWSLCFP